jgi:hypothetical protein
VLDGLLQIRDHQAKHAPRLQDSPGVAQGLQAIPQAQVLQHVGAIHGLAGGLGHGEAPDDVAKLHLRGKQEAIAGQGPAQQGKFLHPKPGGAIKVAPAHGD